MSVRSVGQAPPSGTECNSRASPLRHSGSTAQTGAKRERATPRCRPDRHEGDNQGDAQTHLSTAARLACFHDAGGRCTSAPSTAPQSPTPLTGNTPLTEARSEVALQQGFAHWVTSFRDSAHSAGIDEATLRIAFDDIHYLPRVVELDRAQPEFTRTVWDYLDSAVTPHASSFSPNLRA